MVNLRKLFLAASLLICASSVQAAQPFAVVELFTSEGCSSCPSADAFFKELTAQARKDNAKVYTLGFHVGYWNHLGWEDPFSQEAYSDRQRAYANIHNSKSVYTPQMVVNGQSAFSGNNYSLAQKAVNLALAAKPAAELKLSRLMFNAQGRRLTVKYTASGDIENAFLMVAIVERGLVSDVTRGENTGQRLRHDNTVRKFESRKFRNMKGDNGTFEISIPKDIDLDNASLIGFLQDPRTLIILAADGFDL